MISKVFNISRQAYGQFLKSHDKELMNENRIIQLIKPIRKRMPRIGGIKLYDMLKNKFKSEGIKCGRDKFYKILKQRCLLVPKKKKFIRTTDSNHRFLKHKNNIKGIKISKPEQVWQSDITYIRTKQGFMYLSLITDSYSKKIMGYQLSNNLKTKSSKLALLKAIKNRKYPNRKLIHHSDRGLQYCSPEYTDVLDKHNIKISMTTKYDPYENAIAERVNGILKQEFSISDARMSKNEISNIIDQSIFIYNNERPHFSCNLMTPNKAHTHGRYIYKKWGKFAMTEIWN